MSVNYNHATVKVNEHAPPLSLESIYKKGFFFADVTEIKGPFFLECFLSLVICWLLIAKLCDRAAAFYGTKPRYLRHTAGDSDLQS